MQVKGTIIDWNDKRGFGFLKPAGGSQKVFVHIKAFKDRRLRPRIGETIYYTPSRDSQGRPQASNAFRKSDHKNQSRSRTQVRPSHYLLPILFLTGLGLSVLFRFSPPILLYIFLGMSLVTYVVYGLDKAAAEMDKWRTPEAHLHLLSLLGGWPGAWIAQQFLRHKSKKTSFRVVYWLTVIANLACLYWLHTSEGKRLLASLLT